MSASLMMQGTGSNAGKSLITAGLCRAFSQRGLRVLPFKPQNMSNNAAVTLQGGEIGRAQALQALACGVEPTVDMNPILLKPETENGAQIIIRGERTQTLKARKYMANRQNYLPAILQSFEKLKSQSDLVLVEGAGSPAEINLRQGDIANMGFAQAAGVPAVLIGDIHRGGVIASIIGTLKVLSDEDSAMLKAFLINNFHGDVSLFGEAESYLETCTGKPCAGVIPHFANAARLPSEDAVVLDEAVRGEKGKVKIAVPRLSRIANFDDLDPLKLEPDVVLEIVQPGMPLPADADLILIPGSKATMSELAYFRAQGWDIDLAAHVRRQGRVLGLCGGYQMMGVIVHDLEGFEGPAGSAPGLGLLDVQTTLTGDKTLEQVFALHVASGEKIAGYKMHMGRTKGPDRLRPFAQINAVGEGAISADGLAEGTYLHGLFSADAFRASYLERLGASSAGSISYNATIEATLDELARHLERHVDLDLLLKIARGN